MTSTFLCSGNVQYLSLSAREYRRTDIIAGSGNMFGSYLTVNSTPLYEANSTFSSVLLINHVHAFKQLVENTILFHAFSSMIIRCESIRYLVLFCRSFKEIQVQFRQLSVVADYAEGDHSVLERQFCGGFAFFPKYIWGLVEYNMK